MSPDEELEMVSWALKDNADAIEFFGLLCQISQTFDDVWDGDKPVNREAAAVMMMKAMVDLPRNRFFQMMTPRVLAMIENAWMTWMESNDLEETGARRLLEISYITRSVMTGVLIEMAGIIAGRGRRRHVAKEVRKLVYLDNEPFEDYLHEHLGG